jgi:hypothetical protein
MLARSGRLRLLVPAITFTHPRVSAQLEVRGL